MKRSSALIYLLCFILVCVGVAASKIMVVQSYDENYAWSRELLEGIIDAFADESIQWKVFYMDTRLQTSEEWKVKAGKMATEEAEIFGPDLVIACDDNAQEYFAKAYTAAPVVFCGVNLDLARYSYPGVNVTGVRETLFAEETVELVLDLFPDCERVYFIGDDSETVVGMVNQLEDMSFRLDKEVHTAGTFEEWKEVVQSVPEEAAIVILADRTLKDENGRTLNTAEITKWTVQASRAPVFAMLDFEVRDGALAGVVNSGFYEGRQAGVIASRILSGLSPSEISPENSKNGHLMLDIESLLARDISLDRNLIDRVDEVVSKWPVSAKTVLNLLVSSFEERVNGILTSLRVLAATPQAINNDWQGLRPILEKFNESYEGLGLYVLPDGGYYTVQRGWTGLNLSDRGYFPTLLKGEEVKGYQVMSRSTGKRSVVFGTPVWKEGSVSGFVGLSAFFQEWNFRLLSDFQQFSGVNFYAFDAQNSLALSNNTALLLGTLEVPVPGLSDRLKALGGEGSFLFTDQDRLGIAEYKRSRETGWVFILTRELELESKTLELDLLLAKVQRELQENFNRLDSALSKGAQKAGKILDSSESLRLLLRELHEENPQVVNASYIDREGVLKLIYPSEYEYIQGVWIGEQEQLKKLHETGKPVLSEHFKAAEGFSAVDLEWPVFDEAGYLEGSLSFLIRPESFLAPIIIPNNQAPYEFWIMQPDGTIFYDQDTAEVGRNLFKDPLYEPFEELVELGKEISASDSGRGHYTFYAKGIDRIVKKEVSWSSIGLHGTKWRLVLTKVIE